MLTKNKNKTVFVGVSGGVDSSVAAALLIKEGYTVVGVFIRTWTPDFIECTWRDERRDAMRVCAHLGIPFLECDAEEAYKKGVADYMIEEYKKGNTPNPDVMCNREVKFGTFWDFAKSHGVDFIATGHYAINRKTEHGFVMEKSPDVSKDQSYFLWTLTQEDLAHTLFPVGHLQKTEVRKIASKLNLPTQIKKDSQGVCFLGPLDMKEFLSHYIEAKQGEVLDEEGTVIGSHDGAFFYTIGERHGFTISKKTAHDTPYYVIDKNMEDNTITVSNSTAKESTTHLPTTISIGKTNWITSTPEEGEHYTAHIRYHGEDLPMTVESISQEKARIIFENPIRVSRGQSIVIHDKNVCIGGGVVE